MLLFSCAFPQLLPEPLVLCLQLGNPLLCCLESGVYRQVALVAPVNSQNYWLLLKDNNFPGWRQRVTFTHELAWLVIGLEVEVVQFKPRSDHLGPIMEFVLELIGELFLQVAVIVEGAELGIADRTGRVLHVLLDHVQGLVWIIDSVIKHAVVRRGRVRVLRVHLLLILGSRLIWAHLEGVNLVLIVFVLLIKAVCLNLLGVSPEMAVF